MYSYVDLRHNLKKLVSELEEDYKTGFSFAPTSIRLLSNSSGIEITKDLEDKLKEVLFRRSDNIYYPIDVVAKANDRTYLLEQSEKALKSYGCFDLDRLYQICSGNLNLSCLRSIQDFIDYFEFINGERVRCVLKDGFHIARYKGQINLINIFSEIAQKITEQTRRDFYGVINMEDLLETYPLFSEKLISDIIKNYSNQLIETNINGITCFKVLEDSGLPDNFSEILSDTIDKLDRLEIPVSDQILNAVLSYEMNVNFNNDYEIPDLNEFRRIVKIWYKKSETRKWKSRVFVEVVN